jgi:putative SOS response-associated peptidase YedK
MPFELPAHHAWLGGSAICNDFEQQIAYQAYRDQMLALDFEIPGHESDLDLAQKADVRINDTAAVIVGGRGRAELTPMRWSFPPARPGAGPLFNFRSEGRSFAKARRCIVPASAFYEFTVPAAAGQKRKDKWRFTLAGGRWMGVAGLWRPAEGNQPALFTLLTCDAGPDIAPLHKRQIVILEPQAWGSWFMLDRPEAELLAPTPAGTLAVARV